MTPRSPAPEDQPVRLAKSLLTGNVFAVTSYSEKPHPDPDRAEAGETVLVAEAKADVTSDYRALADAEHAARQLLDDPLGQAAGRPPGAQLDEAEEARLRNVIRAATATGVHSDTLDQVAAEAAGESGAG